MRCPKCGYISFDHVDTCLKCNKAIPESSVQAEGTTFNVEAPSFLKIQSSKSSTSKLMDLDDDFGEIEEDTDIIDPDLNILLEEDVEDEHDGEIEFNGTYTEIKNGDFAIKTDDEEDEEEFIALGDVDDDEPEIDLGQFGDFKDDEIDPAEDLQITMPDELADISDLSHPKEMENEDVNIYKESGGGGQISGDGFDLNLDLDDLDSNFSLSANDDDSSEKAIGDLSFDDIGLSDEPAPATPAPVKSDTFDDMDSDLDFELDLGDLFKPKE